MQEHFSWAKFAYFFRHLDLEAENDCPDETQDHPGVPVHNILRTNVLQADLNTHIINYKKGRDASSKKKLKKLTIFKCNLTNFCLERKIS